MILSTMLTIQSHKSIQAYLWLNIKVPSVTLSQNQNVLCVVCHVSTTQEVIMIPVKFTCSTNWTVEYPGYLMIEAWIKSVAIYECVYMVWKGSEKQFQD